jgi:predicted transcriptional regulator
MGAINAASGIVRMKDEMGDGNGSILYSFRLFESKNRD